MAEFNIPELYRRAFGYVAYPYFPNNTTDEVKELPAYETGDVSSFRAEKTSLLGTPLFMPVQMQISDPGKPVEMIYLPNEPIVEISGSKNIVKTPIDGNDGTFKELYAMNDYVTTIRGIAVQEDGTDEYPDKIVRQLRTICELKGSVKIVCKLLTYFNVDLVAIESFEFPALEGSPGVQPYVINCISDKVYKLELKEEK